MLLQNVWKLHGLPLSLTSNRDLQFISEVWKNLYRFLVFLPAYLHHFIQRQMNKVRLLIKRWKNIFAPLLTINKMIDQTNYLWQILRQITIILLLPDCFRSLFQETYIHVWALILLIFQIPQSVSGLTKKKL